MRLLDQMNRQGRDSKLWKRYILLVGRGKPEQKAFREQVWRKQGYKEAKQQKSRGTKNRKAAKTGVIKANLRNEWEAQRQGEINSGSQQTPCVRRGEKGRGGRKRVASPRASPADQEREICQDRPANYLGKNEGQRADQQRAARQPKPLRRGIRVWSRVGTIPAAPRSWVSPAGTTQGNGQEQHPALCSENSSEQEAKRCLRTSQQ